MAQQQVAPDWLWMDLMYSIWTLQPWIVRGMGAAIELCHAAHVFGRPLCSLTDCICSGKAVRVDEAG